MGRTRFLLILDIALLVIAVILQAVRFTGLEIHEWLGLVIAIPLLVHLVFQWQWITSTWRRAMAQKQRRAQFNFLLNTLLFVFMTVAVFSGVLASEVVTPDLELSEGRVVAWANVHAFTANTIVGLVGLHLALNWRWIVSAWRLHVLRPLTGRGVVPAPAELTTDPEDAT